MFDDDFSVDQGDYFGVMDQDQQEHIDPSHDPDSESWADDDADTDAETTTDATPSGEWSKTFGELMDCGPAIAHHEYRWQGSAWQPASDGPSDTGPDAGGEESATYTDDFDGQSIPEDEYDEPVINDDDPEQVADDEGEPVPPPAVEIGEPREYQRVDAPGDRVDDPHRLAAAVIGNLPVGHLRHWRESYYYHEAGRYRQISEEEVETIVLREMRNQFNFAYENEMREYSGDGPPPQKRKTTRPLMHDTTNVLRTLPAVRIADTVCPPCWIDGVKNGPNPSECVVMANGIFDLSTHIKYDHHPSFFALGGVPYIHDPEAVCPDWDYLMASLPDQETVELVEEWLAYCLTPDMSKEKFLLIVGHPRSGKGTILHVLKHLVGIANHAAISLNTFGNQFALSALPGKLVATEGDVRLKIRADEVQTAVARLLTIVGRDSTSVDVKHKDPLSADLTCRFTFACNRESVPKIGDPDGAVAARSLVMMTGESHAGREDLGLKDRIIQQLPGIFNRVVLARQRLKKRGQFLQPESGRHIVNTFAGNPVRQFVRDCCEMNEEKHIPTEHLREAWFTWCRKEGKQPGDEKGVTFGRDLMATFKTVTSYRPTINGKRVQCYSGIRLRGPNSRPADEVYHASEITEPG